MKLKRSLRAAVGTLLLAAPALADTVTIDDSIVPGDPTMPVVFILSPDCNGQGVFPVLFHSYPFTVGAAGTYDVSVTSDAGFASVYIFSPTFDPANGFPTCIAGDNSGNPVTLSEPLTPGTQYYVVPFDDTSAQLGGAYSLVLSGPGNVFVEGQESVLAIPTVSTWGLAALAMALGLAGVVVFRRRRAA